MILVQQWSDDAVVLEVEGALTGPLADEFGYHVEQAAAGEHRSVTVDLAASPAIDSACIGRLLRASSQLRQQQRSFDIRGCSDSLYSALTALRLHEVIPIQR